MTPPPKKKPTNKRWGLQDLPFAPVLGPNLTPPPPPSRPGLSPCPGGSALGVVALCPVRG